MICDSAILVDTDGDITIKGEEFRWTKGLWELLKDKKGNQNNITTDVMKTYKKILVLTNAHLTEDQPDGKIHVTLTKISRRHITPLSAEQARCIESALRRRWVK